jgi:hypothetical protein
MNGIDDDVAGRQFIGQRTDEPMTPIFDAM